MSRNLVYVYQLIDPRNYEVFYVGKGRKNRPAQHVRDAKRGTLKDNQLKRKRILDILTSGLEPQIEVVGAYATDQEALDHEAELIASMKGLTNILARGWARSPAEEERMSDRRLRAYLMAHREFLPRAWRGWRSLMRLRDVRWPGIEPYSKLYWEIIDGQEAFFARCFRLLEEAS